MNIYFGKVPQEDVIDFGGEFFEQAGESYDFVLNVSAEGFVIKDSCDRYVPFAHSDCVKLIHALRVAEDTCKCLAYAEKTLDALDGKTYLLN